MSEYLPGLAGVPATQSNISDIDGEKGILAYRGYPIEQLAESSTFEETTLLLLDGKLPTAAELDVFDKRIRASRRTQFHIRDECLTDAEACEDLNYIHNMTVELIGRMATMVAMWEHLRNGYEPPEPRKDLSYAENFLYMFTGEELI